LELWLIYYISQLKKYVGHRSAQSTLPAIDEEGLIAAEPLAVLDCKLGKLGNKAAVYVLILWTTGSREEAIWQPYSDIEQRFPHFDLSA